MNKIFNFLKVILQLHKIIWLVFKKSDTKQITPISVIESNKDVGIDVNILKRPGLIAPDQRIYGLDLTTQKKSLGVYYFLKKITDFSGINFNIERKSTAQEIRHIPKNFKLTLIPSGYAGFAFRMGVQNYIVSETLGDKPQQARLNTCASNSVRMGGRIL